MFLINIKCVFHYRKLIINDYLQLSLPPQAFAAFFLS